jgi:DNA-binding MarR family transcriptional regulator
MSLNTPNNMGNFTGFSDPIANEFMTAIFKMKHSMHSISKLMLENVTLDSVQNGLTLSTGESLTLRFYSQNDTKCCSKMAGGENENSDSLETADKIGQKLQFSNAAISQITNKLVEKGLVTRETDQNDRRKQVVTLTELGKNVVETTLEQSEKIMKEIIDEFGNNKMNQLIELLDEFYKSIEKNKEGK